MMRHNVRTVPAATTVASFRETFPLGSPAHVIAVDEEGRYAGMVRVADAYATKARADEPIRSLLRSTTAILLPGMAIKEAVLAFDCAEAEALAVVDSSLHLGVIGLLMEADAIRRHAAQLAHLSRRKPEGLAVIRPSWSMFGSHERLRWLLECALVGLFRMLAALLAETIFLQFRG